MKIKDIRLVVVSCLMALGVMTAEALPLGEDFAAELRQSLPVTMRPFPAKSTKRLNPLVAETSKNVDRKKSVQIGVDDFRLTAISEDRTAVELEVPVKAGATEKEKLWFKAEDIFGGIPKPKVEPLNTTFPHRAYSLADAKTPDLVAWVSQGTGASTVGYYTIKKKKYPVALIKGSPARLCLVDAAPGIDKNGPEYQQRVKEMKAEYAFRNGRPWGKAFHALLNTEAASECAGMAADFARYLFDRSLIEHPGTRFDKASEIRAGDIIHIKGHYFAVFARRGNNLDTIEGNMNASVCQSTSRYTIVDDKTISAAGTGKCEFEYGLHYLE